MTRLKFFKTLPMVGLAFVTKPIHIPTSIKAEIIKLPASINKRVVFIENNIQFEFILTDNIFIKMPDNTYHENVFKDQCKVVGRATSLDLKRGKHLIIESPAFAKVDAKQFADKYSEEIYSKLVKVFNSEASSIQTPIRKLQLS